jgi:hypothetical protein
MITLIFCIIVINKKLIFLKKIKIILTMNGGKVYYSLNSKLNNDLIKIIQQYNIIGNKYNKYLKI